MRIFGLEISRVRRKGPVGPTDLSPTYGGGWWPVLGEARPGDWQRGIKGNRDSLLTFHAVFACVTRIAGDISKLGVWLVEEGADGVKRRIRSASPFLAVLTRPNRYQTWIEFMEQWILSLLLHGNTYVLKVRDGRNMVVALYILDARRVQPLVAPGAAVFYRLQSDNLSTQDEAETVPAIEVIHHRINPLYHPLVGLSPLVACQLAAGQGLEIQNTSAEFFANGAWPGGILTAPQQITDVTAERLKTTWDQNFGKGNRGKVAVLGDGLSYNALSIKPVDAQMLEQLKYSAEMVCGVFHVPPFMVGIGSLPANGSGELLNQIYYSNCLQRYIEGVEWALWEGLGLPDKYEIQFCIDDLLRMDSRTQMEVLKIGVGAALVGPNEGRKKLNLPPVEGGDTPYMQQQNYSLAALNRRDRAGAPASTLDEPGPPKVAAVTLALSAPAMAKVDPELNLLKVKTLTAGGRHSKGTTRSGGVIDWGELFEPTDLRPSLPPLTIVTGPPASGKSTYVVDRAGPDDFIIDMDAEAQRLGIDRYSEDWEDRIKLLQARNDRLRELSESEAPAAWFTCTAPKAQTRSNFADQLEANEVIVMITPKDICLSRIRDTRPDAPQSMYDAVQRWFDTYSPRPGDKNRVEGLA